MSSSKDHLANLKQRLKQTLEQTLKTYNTPPLPLLGLRQKQAIENWEKMNLPTNKEEGYRYTPLATSLAKGYQVPTTTSKPTTPYPCNISIQLLQNQKGHQYIPKGTHPHLSSSPPLLKGVTILPLKNAKQSQLKKIILYLDKLPPLDQETFVTFNQAFSAAPLWINIPDGLHLKDPLCITHYLSSPTIHTTQPNLLITVGKEASLTLIESFHISKSWTNRVATIILAPKSKVEHYTLHPANTLSWQTLYTYAHQQKNSHYTHHSTVLGSSMMRHQIHIKLNEKGAKATLQGSYAATMKQHVEHDIKVIHNAPNTQSSQHYRGLIGQESFGVFRSQIIIPTTSPKSSAEQNHHTWHCHPQAQSHTSPQLSIETSNVTCKHGATIAQPPSSQLFYLRSRGISLPTAKILLFQGFLTIPLAPLSHHQFKEEIKNMIHAHLQVNLQPNFLPETTP